MPSVFSDTDWACDTCTHPNKGGKTCVMCQTPRPKRHKVAAPTMPPLPSGAAPPLAIETAAASADPLLVVFPGTPRAEAAPSPAIETAVTVTDQLRAVFPGVGTLKDGYVRNVPLPRVPREQRASPELTAPKDRIQLPGYSILPAWIPTLPKIGNVLGFSQRLL